MRRGAPLVALALAACAPTLDDPASRVTSRRVLAVRFEPAEAAPGATVRAVALVADPADADGAPPRWSWCALRAPLTEQRPADARCLVDGAWQQGAGDGASVDTAVPTDACARFGPDPPADGDGTARPVDADATGGWYAPLRLALGDTASLAFARVRCNLAGVTREQFVEYTRRARPNGNPALTVDRLDGETAVPLAEPRVSVGRGASITLRARWPACAGSADCAGAERYVVFDPATRALVEHREAMRVSWYVTAGAVRELRTGVPRDGSADETRNVYTAPTQPGAARVWVVLRDERGGVAWASIRVDVQ